MPNQRASGQTLIGCHLDAEFLAEIDRARGGKSRSQFLREVLYLYLTKQCGIKLPSQIVHAPDRTGKGGRTRKSKAVPKPPGIKAVAGTGKAKSVASHKTKSAS